MRIQFHADSPLFVPAPEDVPQSAGEVLGRFARGRPSPHRAEVNLLIKAVRLGPRIDEARPRCSDGETILRNAVDLPEPFPPKFARDNKLAAAQRLGACRR